MTRHETEDTREGDTIAQEDRGNWGEWPGAKGVCRW